ncbi:MAG: hypothetical protein GXY85_09780 [Candidatus Brocadiaceae bacterium]|nr:hypothetical protein [Candidatus Brocadiaceae bacterium]
MAKRWLTTVLLVMITVGLVSYLFVFSVRVDQVAAQYRLGKLRRIIRPPLELAGETLLERQQVGRGNVPVVERAGWFLKLPWPFDKVRKQDQRVNYVDGPLTQMQLPDENQLIPRVYATWRIIDPDLFESSFMGDPEAARERVKEIIGGRTPEVFGGYTLRDLVNTDPGQLKFDQIEEEVYREVKQAVEGPDYGIEICDLGITWIALPEDATSAVFGRMELERTTESEKLTEEGKALKRQMVARANKEREIMLANAEADARRIRAEGEAEAGKSYEVFARDQEFAIFLRRLESLKLMATNAEESRRPLTFVLSTQTPPFGVLDSGSEAGTGTPGLPDLTVPDAVRIPTTDGGE